MTLGAPRLPFALDPLIAEAKLRMRRRRFLLAVVALALTAVVVSAVLLLGSRGGGQLYGTATHQGAARLPGMTRVIAYHESGGKICGSKGSLPPYCSTKKWKVRRSWFQQWILTAALRKLGPTVKRVDVPLAYELSHPGPAEVSDEVDELAVPEQAGFLHTPRFAEATDLSVLSPSPSAAINGGTAGISACCGLPQPSIIRFAWLSGRDLVQVTVTGANLSVAEAQRIALRVGPS